jgi:hypothetical protein
MRILLLFLYLIITMVVILFFEEIKNLCMNITNALENNVLNNVLFCRLNDYKPCLLIQKHLRLILHHLNLCHFHLTLKFK